MNIELEVKNFDFNVETYSFDKQEYEKSPKQNKNILGEHYNIDME